MTNTQDFTVQHSTGRSFATWGCGYIAYNASMAALREGKLSRVIAPSFVSSEVPDEIISVVPKGRLEAVRSKLPYRVRVRFGLDYFFGDNDYDLGARQYILPEPGVFHGWSHQALFSMRKAKQLGLRTVLERPNTHPVHQSDLVGEERKKYGFKGNVDGPFEQRKCITELNEADMIVVCSDFAKDSHVAHGVPAEKIRVINYGVDTEVFTPQPKPDSTFRVVYCGLVCLRKGVQYLLQAWKELGWTDSELWLLGVITPDAQAVVESHRDLPGLKVVGHVNSRPQLAELYRQASLFAFPSVEDGFAMVVTEAMACAVPVVISDNTGARDVVEQDKNGWVVPTFSVEALKEKFAWAKSHPTELKEMGIYARGTAENNTWLHYSERLMAVYREVLSK